MRITKSVVLAIVLLGLSGRGARCDSQGTDDPSPQAAEGPHLGTRTVSRWREEFPRDFATRLERCQSPRSGKGENSRPSATEVVADGPWFHSF